MKMIIAVIQPEKLNQVKKLLYANEINRFIVEDCFGHSDEHSVIETYRGVEMEVDLKKKIRVSMAVNDEFVDKAVKAILEGGRTGKIGDGKVFVLPLDECYSISSGKSGNDAIG